MTFQKIHIGLYTPNNQSELGIYGGFEPYMFQDENGRRIFYLIETLNPPYNPFYVIYVEATDGWMKGITGATVQLSDSVTGEVAGSCVTSQGRVNVTSGAVSFYNSAGCRIGVPKGFNLNNIFLEII
ncbi:MAG: hypothetical protein QXU98_06470 [Candidatus Parvarchaeota archaeon]